MSDKKPRWGFTRHGHPVHEHTLDHLPSEHWWDKVNKTLAIFCTKIVGTMWCAYAFAIFDLLALPTAIKGGTYGIVQWVASFFLQLVLLSVIMVGQNLQSVAADARAAKTFEDTELLCDRLDTHTEGGITEVLNAIKALDEKIVK
jgi:hypothetical protein